MTHSAIVVLVAGLCAAGASEPPRPVEANRMVEVSFSTAKAYGDPFNEVELNVVFTPPDGGAPLEVPAFWAGKGQWRVRYSSAKAGVHRYKTECSDRENRELNGVEGEVTVVPYAGENQLYRHGPIRVADKRYFEHADGTPFLWLGDTWWMGLSKRLVWPEEFKTLAADRRKKGFNVVQIVAGLYPDMPAFDDRGRNEAGFPWEKDYARIDPAYFDAADRRIEWLVEEGLMPCIVGAWGYHLPWLGVERMKKHWRVLVARYGALPVVWCVAGEGDMPYYLSKTKDADRVFQKSGLTEVAAYLRKIDPFHRLVTIHPPQTARAAVEDVSVLDFDMLQTGHGDWGSVASTLQSIKKSRAAAPPLPTVVGEVCYEGILETCFEDLQRFLVWSSYLSGSAGHTYGANGIWQVNRRGQPYGASPHGGNWGNRPWDEAMALAGSGQVGLARKLLLNYPWPRFEPHPEWCRSAGKPKADPLWGKWIWYPEGEPAKDAPVASRYFRRVFQVPEGKTVSGASLRISVDDRFTAYLNGERIGSAADWHVGKVFADVAAEIKPGKNVLAVVGENRPAPVEKNPAGLIASLEIHFPDGESLAILSDAGWRVSREELPGWLEAGFDDRDWPPAKVIAGYGGGPWGRLTRPAAEYLVPYPAGIPREVRIIYLPVPEPVVVEHLEADVKYKASALDPVTGLRSELGEVEPDAQGWWSPPIPVGLDRDRVLIIEAVGGR